MTLPVFEFMRRFLQHVLPGGFHKVRSYGFLTPKYKEIFAGIKLELDTSTGKPIAKSEKADKGNHFRRCPKCKIGTMVVSVHIFHTKKGILYVRPPP